MNLYSRIPPLYCLLLLMLFCLFPAAPLTGGQFTEEVSTEDYLFVKGIIRSVSMEDQMLTLKQRKGPTLSFSIDKDTVFEGFYRLEELKIRQKLKIWYQPNEQGNKAMKILKPLELGC